MKLLRFGKLYDEKPGVLYEGTLRDVSEFGQDYDEEFFQYGGLLQLRNWLGDHIDDCPVIDAGVRIGSPVGRPSKIVCIGLNYEQHASESGMVIPKEPVLFFKATTAICGPFDDLILPKSSEKTDWEVELAVVISKRTSYIDKQQALDYIAGYTIHNDYSERNFQLERGGQWVKGKSCDTFAPLGPYLVTPDEVADPHKLNLWLKVNGEQVQASSTADFVFDIPTVISYISQFMTLLPGDVISTGTPPGVGLGFNPPRYLKNGDVVELGIEGLGTQKQHVKAFPL